MTVIAEKRMSRMLRRMRTQDHNSRKAERLKERRITLRRNSYNKASQLHSSVQATIAASVQCWKIKKEKNSLLGTSVIATRVILFLRLFLSHYFSITAKEREKR